MPRTYSTCAVALAAIVAVSTLAACRSTEATDQTDAALKADPRLIGHFEDDYGAHYTISESLWQVHPGGLYHVDYWDNEDLFVIVQNDENNGANPNMWTRVDWAILDEEQAPWEWGFCLTVYDAPSSTAAASAVPALRDTLLTGCNGFPFTRMKRIEEEDL